MARLVVGIAGAAVGSMFGPIGAQVGFALGSMIGSTFEPNIKSEGPRLTDLTVSSSSYGAVLPYIAGHPRVSGQIVWASKKRELATTTHQGKGGGGGQDNTSYSYEVDVLWMFSENVCTGVMRIWANGKLVWAASKVNGDVNSGMVSASTTHWKNITFYSGVATQLPDPVYEAAVGLGNAPAYRGRATLMMEALQLDSSGQLPNFTFEISSDGELKKGTVISLCHFNVGSANSTVPMPSDPTVYTVTSSTIETAIGPTIGMTAYGNAQTGPSTSGVVFANHTYGGAVLNLHSNYYAGFAAATMDSTFAIGANEDFTIEFSYDRSGSIYNTNSTAVLLSSGPSGAAGSWRISEGFAPGHPPYDRSISFIFAAGGGATGFVPALANSSGFWRVAVTREAGVVRLFVDGVLIGTSPGLVNEAIAGTGSYYFGASDTTPYLIPNDYANCAFDEALYVKGVALYNASYTVCPDEYTDSHYIWLGVNPDLTLQTLVTRLCLRCGLSAAQFDASALASITRPVRSMAISQLSTARAVLEILASTYFFEAVVSDKIYFRPRGSASLLTIPFADLGVGQGAPNPDPLLLTLANDLEIPAQVALSYANVYKDYEVDTQYSDRLLTGQTSTNAIQVPLGMLPAEAKSVADTKVIDGAVAGLTTAISLNMGYAALEPTDVVTAVAEDGALFRLRIAKRAEADGVLTFDCIADNAGVLTQAGVTTSVDGSVGTIPVVPKTTLALLDIPLLRDADNTAGLYVAIGADTRWTGATVYASFDDIAYAAAFKAVSTTTMGLCSTALGAWAGGWQADETNTVTIVVTSGQLSGVTHEAMLLSHTTNAALVGKELIQFREAALNADGTYTLRGLLRGKHGTEASIAGHAVNEAFVLLGTTGVTFTPIASADIGRTTYYKAASKGAKLSATASSKITPTAANLKPLAPINIRYAPAAAGDVTITWDRRTRLSENWLLGSMPLGETVESYKVEILNGTTTVRTATVSAPTFVYTKALQTTDFGSAQSTINCRVTQLSSLVSGAGATTTGTIPAASTAKRYRLTMGGTYEAGCALTVFGIGTGVANSQLRYTTSGAMTIPAVASALCGVLDADPNVVATVSGTTILADVISSLNGYAVAAYVQPLAQQNSCFASTTQEAHGVQAGARTVAWLRVANSITGDNSSVAAGHQLSLGVYAPSGALITLYYTTTAGSGLAALAAFSSAFNADPRIQAAGWSISMGCSSSAYDATLYGPPDSPATIAAQGLAEIMLTASLQTLGARSYPAALAQIVQVELVAGVAVYAGDSISLAINNQTVSVTAIAGDTTATLAAALVTKVNALGGGVTAASGTPASPTQFYGYDGALHTYAQRSAFTVTANATNTPFTYALLVKMGLWITIDDITPPT